MNCPEDLRLHFLSSGEWHRYISPRHGVKASIAPSYIRDAQLENWPSGATGASAGRTTAPFTGTGTDQTFDEPFYFGRLGNMAMILVFDTPKWLRFFCSPTGGGASLIEGQSCPAWDFEWVIPEEDYQVGRRYTFNLRLVYMPFVSEDGVLDEYRRAQAELGFQRIPSRAAT